MANPYGFVQEILGAYTIQKWGRLLQNTLNICKGRPGTVGLYHIMGNSPSCYVTAETLYKSIYLWCVTNILAQGVCFLSLISMCKLHRTEFVFPATYIYMNVCKLHSTEFVFPPTYIYV